MTQPGRASIEIVGDVSKLGRQLQRDTQRAVDNVDLDTENLGDQISEGVGRGVDEAIEKLSELNPAVVLSSENFANRFKDAADEVVDAFDEISDHFARTTRDIDRDSERAFGGISNDADGASDAIGGLARSARSAFSRLGDTLASVGSTITDSLGSLLDPSSLITVGLWAAALAALSSVIIGLSAALADLAGFVTILPGAIGALTATLIVGAIAFQGFGDALSAVIDGDPEKIAEAMERLAPAAQKVVKEFQELLPLFRRVGDSIQQEFFEPLVGIVENFGENVLPRLRNELNILAQAMGRAFGNLGDLVTDTENVAILERLLASTARITDELGAAVADLGQAFLNALDAGLPGLEELSGRLADALTNFAAFINTSIEDGSFQEFLDDAIATFDELMGLTGALGELLGVLFGATDDAGRSFIGTLTDLTQRMTEFFRSADGQRVLERVGDTLEFIGQVAGFVINALVFLGEAGNDLVDAFNAVADFFDRAGNDIARFWDGVTSTTGSAASAVGGFFTDLWATVTTTWEGIADGVANAVDSVVGFVQSIPDRIAGFIESIPGRVSAVFDILLDGITTGFAFVVGAVIVFFTDLPGQVAAGTNALVAFVTGKFEELKANIAAFISGVITFFETLPTELGRIGGQLILWAETTWNSIVTTIGEAVGAAIAFVQTLPARFGEFFSQAYTAVRDRVVAMVEFVKTIPAKIGEALGNVGRMLYDSGARIIQGLIDGISSRIGQLRAKIVEAVQQIRDHLPFSPAKVGPLSGAGSPDIAGATIARMIAEGLESGLPLITGAANQSAGAVADAGVTPLTAATPGGGSPALTPTSINVEQQPIILVQIGNEQLDAHVERIVEERVQIEVRRLMAGSRGI